ncbi:MaoC family dehydratase [Acinetobacter sp. ESBL14]|uniref:MaoC family dehydratase n=1 Tax=Acinetobacter sp. ESBL14 TaxID=3077329 RepID=UPI002FC9A66D
MGKTSVIYLDDLQVGTEFFSREYALSEQQIINFAKEFDPQIFHLDGEAAKGTLFKGIAASGWHTAAITMKLLVDSLPIGSGIIGAGGEIKWPNATRPNDILKVVSKVLQITPSRSKPDRGIVSVECKTLNQHDIICQHLITQLVVMRR